MDFAPGRGQTARERPSQMLDATPFTIGADVSCSDGSCGELTRVVVDPITRSATHLVVDPKHRRGLGRLVPIALITEAAAEIQLNCTTEQFSALHHAEETQFSPGNLGPSGYGDEHTLSWPNYGLGRGRYGTGAGDGYGMLGMSGTAAMGGFGGLGGLGNAAQPIVQDLVPSGKVDIRRGQQVHATDGPIGKVQGVVIDRRDLKMTHVLLQEGHLWGRKQVAIPSAAVAGVDDGISLTLSKDEVRDLPPVDIEDPAAPDQ